MTTSYNAGQQQMHPTSPWTEWADKFASPAFANAEQAQQAGSQQAQADDDRPCTAALMDCYNG